MHISLLDLLKIKHKSIKEFEIKAREVVFFAIQNKRPYEVFRIAKELQELECDVEDMEDFIISEKDPFYIYKYAREIKAANVNKLQNAIIETNNYPYIAKFACFVPGADTTLLENIIVASNNALAAHTYIKYGKHPKVEKLKHILLKSKKPRYLYTLALTTDNPEDITNIENLILASKSNMYVRLFATHIPGANILRLEERILQTNNFEEIKKFAKSVHSDRLNRLILLM